MNRRRFFEAMSALALGVVFGRRATSVTPEEVLLPRAKLTWNIAEPAIVINGSPGQSPDEIVLLVKEELIRAFEDMAAEHERQTFAAIQDFVRVSARIREASNGA